jgi:hypothetical protein
MTTRTYAHRTLAIAVTALLAAAATHAAKPGGGSKASQTAQSLMAAIEPADTAYQIEGNVVWRFDDDAAAELFTNARTGTPARIEREGTGGMPAAPEPRRQELDELLRDRKCTLYDGGTIDPVTYEQTARGGGGWQVVYEYAITNSGTFAPRTAWSASGGGGDDTVTIPYSGFFAGESYLESSKTKKYSFTLLNSLGLSRVGNAVVTLEQQTNEGWSLVASTLLDDFDTDADGESDTLTAVPATEDFEYLGNTTFGAPTLFGSLHHADGGKPKTWVSAILVDDTFTGNDNDLPNGNVHVAPFSGEFTDVPPGTYRLRASATVKSNEGSGEQSVSVTDDRRVTVQGCR